MNKNIDNKLENFFPSAMSFFGYFLMGIGLLLLYYFAFLASSIFIFIGSLISFSITGIQIDVEKKQYRTYFGFLGLRYGKWKSLDKYPYLTILHHQESTTTFSRSNRGVTVDDMWFDVCLLTENHRDNQVVKRLKNSHKAIAEIKTLYEKLGLSVVKYNPEVSEATRLRRQREQIGKRHR